MVFKDKDTGSFYTKISGIRQLLPQFFRKSDGEPVLLEGETGLYVQPISEVRDVVLQDATQSSNVGEPFTVGSFKTLTQRISGTSTSRTILYEFTMDGENWEPLQGVRVKDYNMSNEVTTTNETWKFEIEGLYQIRANVTAISGGNISSKGKAVS